MLDLHFKMYLQNNHVKPHSVARVMYLRLSLEYDKFFFSHVYYSMGNCVANFKVSNLWLHSRNICIILSLFWNRSLRWFELHCCCSFSERNSKFQKLLVCLCKIIKIFLLILGISLAPLFEGFIIDKSQIGWKHHKLPRFLVNELFRTCPLLVDPLPVQNLNKERVGESCRRVCPRSIETRAISMTATKCMCPDKSNYFLVVETHPVENITGVLRWRVTTVRKPSIRRTVFSCSICKI